MYRIHEFRSLDDLQAEFMFFTLPTLLALLPLAYSVTQPSPVQKSH